MICNHNLLNKQSIPIQQLDTCDIIALRIEWIRKVWKIVQSCRQIDDKNRQLNRLQLIESSLNPV